MTNPDIQSFTPTEIWTPTNELAQLDEPIQRAVNEMNQKDSAQLIDGLMQHVERSERGVSFAILKGNNPSEYSNTDALVMFNPYANVATPNMLVRGEFVREVAKFSDVRDANGKLKPVIMLASPGLGGSKLLLSRSERKEVRDGDLGPAAKELLRAVSEKEIGRVALLGFSQGADIALAGAEKANAANLDVNAVAVGDPAGVEDRTRRHLGGDFSKAGSKDFKQIVDASPLDAQRGAVGSGMADFARFGISMAWPPNPKLFKGLGHNTFENQVQTILDEGMVDRLAVAYGGDSAITKPVEIEPSIQRLYDVSGRDSFVSVKVAGANHTWGDQLTLLAKLYMRALS